MNKLQKFIYILIFTSFLTSCGQNTVNNNNTTSKSINQDGLGNNTNKLNEGIKEENGIKKELKISFRCIGCGHCVRVAVDNFKMNSSTYKAEVISQDNIYDEFVQKAIDICPVDAISIS